MNRAVIHADALAYLKTIPNQYKAIVTSLPDPEEVGISIQKWKDWIYSVGESLDAALDKDGIIVLR